MRISNPALIMIILVAILLAVLTAHSQAQYSGGTGDPCTPWEIANIDDLHALAANTAHYGDCFILTADINLDPCLPGRQIYTTAVIAPDTDNSNNSAFDGTPFTGIFDGDGHRILNLTIDTQGASNDYLGLFGQTASPCQLKNLGVVDASITGEASSYLGGLCGSNGDTDLSGFRPGGTISNCYAIATVTDQDTLFDAGGLCGNNVGFISNSYATGNVTAAGASQNIGGLCGANWIQISNSYATANVTAVDGTWNIGGLCGSNWQQISNSYAAGSVTAGVSSQYIGGLIGRDYSASVGDSACRSSFWNNTVNPTLSGVGSANPDPAGVIGVTTAEMMTADTFLDEGWDLVSVWNIEEDQTYPLLRKYSALDTNYDHKIDLIDFAQFADHWLDGVE
ncbi:MAG: hypothetical protein JW936_00455 [Sedimentisphaerales bacterium]|nr:hypothetical protein [Sedimentisphaerales bacterium]